MPPIAGLSTALGGNVSSEMTKLNNMPIIETKGGSDIKDAGAQKPKATKKIQTNIRYKVYGSHVLDKLSESDILNDIALRIRDGRRLIIPIGLPQAGKSMFIASLIAYAFKRETKEDNSCSFQYIVPLEESGIKSITDSLSRNDVLPSTRPNEITIIDLDMKSRYREKPIKITLLDFSGEDFQALIGSRPATDPESIEKIEKILAACVARKAIFAVLSPVDEGMTELGQVSPFDDEEDEQMNAFINKIRATNPKLYHYTKFLLVITKWDKLPPSTSCEKFLRMHRNQLFNEYSSNSKSYGLIPYSVGNVVGNTIIDMVLRSPKNFWYTLYRWCTGKHVLPWWKRWFS